MSNPIIFPANSHDVPVFLSLICLSNLRTKPLYSPAVQIKTERAKAAPRDAPPFYAIAFWVKFLQPSAPKLFHRTVRHLHSVNIKWNFTELCAGAPLLRSSDDGRFLFALFLLNG